MRLLALSFIALVLCSCGQKSKEKTKDADAKVKSQSEIEITEALEQLATDFKFTEGPAIDKDGHVYFTDIPENKIYIWTTSDSLELHKENTNGANGLYFDKDQNLWACEGGESRITHTTPDEIYSAVATEYEGKPFNQTNDVWVNPNGGAYFTDPKYGQDQEDLPQGGEHVFYIHPDDDSIMKVCDDLDKPNGLIGTPDGKLLYVTDPGAEKTYRYEIEEDGTLSNKKLFVEFGGDGMTIDKEGNIYLTTINKPQIDIFSPDGDLIQTIKVPEQPANVTFGGKDRNQLYITARTSLYRVGLNQEGVE